MSAVLTVRELPPEQLQQLLARFGLELIWLEEDAQLPGSYWGDSEAGLIGNRLYIRADTPVHSLLHEGSHFICMDDARRSALVQDAGGDYGEENAVCYLQILLANYLTNFSSERMCMDMDAWGYTFRLGSARAWFEQDAADAREWLTNHGIIDTQQAPTWRVRAELT